MSINLVEEFKEDVIGMLSGTLVDVELDEDDIRRAFRLAKKTWQQKGADNTDVRYVGICVEPNTTTYTLPAEVTDVIRVMKKGTGAITSEDPFAMQTFQQTFNYGSMGGYGGDFFFIYDLTRQIIDNNRQYLADEPYFRFNRRRKQLDLHNPPNSPQTWILEVYSSPTDEEYQEVLWILNWTVAECKIMLGQAYRKLGTISTPSGDNQIGGVELIQEGKQEKQELLEEIEHFVDGDPDGLAIYIG